MENPITVLTAQVRTYLIDLKLREPDRFQVYQHFYGQCEQFEISEEDFFKHVLNPAYRDINFDDLIDDPDPGNEKNTHVFIFGEKIHSLRRLGQVLFDNHQRSSEYLEDMSLIKNHVDTLSTGDDALEFARLYKSENEREKKYLRIIYRLNPKLPYRIADETMSTLESILEKGFQDQTFYNQVYNDFAAGKLLIWLSEVNKEQATKLSGGKSYNSFLRFVYAINNKYPFYMDTGLYSDPQQIVAKAQKDISFREELFRYIENDQLFTWFESVANSDWQVQYVSAAGKLTEQKLKDDQLIHESIEKLIQIVKPGVKVPMLKSSVEKLSFTGVEAGKKIEETIKLKLVGTGYLRAQINFDEKIPGISLNDSKVVFFDLNNQTEYQIILYINPLQLIKDKLYQFKIVIVTEYQRLEIPVEARTVFPVRTLFIHMAKYGAIGFAVMALFRFLLQSFTGTISWLKPDLITEDFANLVPSNHPTFIFLLFVFIIMIAGLYPLIKKVEEI